MRLSISVSVPLLLGCILPKDFPLSATNGTMPTTAWIKLQYGTYPAITLVVGSMVWMMTMMQEWRWIMNGLTSSPSGSQLAL
jgi:hypothetical protein